MRFRAETAGKDWAGLHDLALACEGARLTVEEAEAARLVATRKITSRALSIALSSLLKRRVSCLAARRWAIKAERRLRAHLPRLAALQRVETREMLKAMRNVWPSNPGLAVYRERMGTHDKEPVRFCSKLFGEVAEDLVSQPLRFLLDLNLLQRIARDEDARAAG